MVTAIVINARGKENLEKCLKSLMQTKYPNLEIIVVDCQTINIETWVTEHFKNVKVVHFGKDIGPSASHNVGVDKASPSSEYVAFLDDDAIVEPKCLKELIKAMEEDKKRVVGQPKIKLGNTERLDHTGLAIDALGTWKTTFNIEDRGFKEVFEIFAASFATCIVRRDVFNEAGGFDEDYFIYDDDTDFCWRTRLLGYDIVFVSSAVSRHLGQLAKGLKPRKLYHGAKNRICTMLKNYELKNLCWRICLYYVLTFLSVLAFISLLKPGQALALLKGLAYPVLNFKKTWQKRLRVQANRRITDKSLFQKKLLRKDIYPTIIDAMKKMALTTSKAS